MVGQIIGAGGNLFQTDKRIISKDILSNYVKFKGDEDFD